MGAKLFTDPKEQRVKELLAKLTPDQRGFARHTAELKIRNQVLEKHVAELKAAYDAIYKAMIVLLSWDKDHELRVHETQFLRFKEEYRIDSWFDNTTKEMVFKLLTVHDEPAKVE
jgi:lipopolysaccharide biosynthesis glycosyltransferase